MKHNANAAATKKWFFTWKLLSASIGVFEVYWGPPSPADALGDNTTIRERDPSCIDQTRPVLRPISINDERIPYLDIVALESAARERGRSAAFESPIQDLSVFVFHIQI